MTDENPQSSYPEDSEESWEQRNPEIVRKITIEEYRPVGTLVLTLLYFLIVLLMWLFMYFVEFGGNAPSIIE